MELKQRKNLEDLKRSKSMQYKYICSHCAKVLQGVWPVDHQATWHQGTCDRCTNTAGVASVTNWNWENIKAKKEWFPFRGKGGEWGL